MLGLVLFILLISHTQRRTALCFRWGGTSLASNYSSESFSRLIKRKSQNESGTKKEVKVLQLLKGHFFFMWLSMTPTDVDTHSLSMALSVRNLGMEKRGWAGSLIGHQRRVRGCRIASGDRRRRQGLI